MSTDYHKQAKIGIVICLIDELGIVFLLGTAMFMYKIAEPFLILVNVFLSIIIVFFYYYVQEILTLYLWKFCNENPEMKKKIIKQKRNRRYMFEHKYPMDEVGMCHKISIRDYFVKY